jgi:hypothetical protein
MADETPKPPERHYSDEEMAKLRSLVRAVSHADTLSRSAVATACGLARGTFTNWLGATYNGNNHRIAAKVEAWLTRTYPERMEEAAGLHGDTLASDLGEIVYTVEDGKSQTVFRVIYREWVCAGHIVLVGEAPDGRRRLFIQRLKDGGTRCEVVDVDLHAAVQLAGAVANGQPIRKPVAAIEAHLAAATLCLATDARRLL